MLLMKENISGLLNVPVSHRGDLITVLYSIMNGAEPLEPVDVYIRTETKGGFHTNIKEAKMVIILSIAVLGISQLREAEILGRCQFIVDQSNGNPALPVPTLPDIAVLQSAVDIAGQAKANTVNGGKHLTVLKNDAYKTLFSEFNAFTAWVQAVSNGDEIIISSTGLFVKEVGAPAGLLGAPQNLRAIYTDNSGTLRFDWEPVEKARAYPLEISQTPEVEESWTPVTTVTRSDALVSGLNSGERYWGRVAAINAAGRSNWSDPATNLVA